MFVTTLLAAAAMRQTATVFAPGPSPLDNPLKGYAAYSEPTFTHYLPSQMAFVEVPWKEIEPQEGKYRFDLLDEHFNTPLAKGKDIVLRIWLDYPNQPLGVPTWLVNQGLKLTSYTDFGGGKSPDYEDPDLKKGLSRLVAALGKKYGDLNRVKVVQLGLLGHWGEWHDYPRTELFASDSTQRFVIDLLRKAFPQTQLEARNPAYSSCHRADLGFHDDMIPDDTLPGEDWHFLPSLQSNGQAGNWKANIAGGEMVPGAAVRYLTTDFEMLKQAIKLCHFSWIGPYCPAIEASSDPVYKSHSNEIVQLLGYTFRLTKGTIPDSITSGQQASIELDGENVGVAPFYYPWPIHLALISEDGKVATEKVVVGDIRTWQPGSFNLKATTTWTAAAGTYSLGIQISDPANRSSFIKFANTLPIQDGWTILRKGITVK